MKNKLLIMTLCCIITACGGGYNDVTSITQPTTDEFKPDLSDTLIVDCMSDKPKKECD